MVWRVLLALAVLVLAMPALAQRVPGHERYGVDDGLASGEVVSLAEDPEGYLWVAVFAAGVYRFDGQRFQHFGRAQGLESERAKRIHIDHAGRVRVATLAGAFRFDGERFQREPLLGEVAVFDILETRSGDLWYATMDGAVRVHEGRALRLGLAEGLPMANATALAEGPDNAIWIGTTRGLARFHRGAVQSFLAGQAGRHDDYITRLLVAPSGPLWVATDWGLSRFAAGQFHRHDLGVGARHLYVLDLLLQPPHDPGGSGRLRVATLGSGVLSINGDGDPRTAPGQLSLDQGLPSANIWALAPSRSGGLWIGTEAHGILLRETGPFEQVLAQTRVSSEVPTTIARAANGDLWMATAGAGLLRLDGEEPARPLQGPLPRRLGEREGLPCLFATRLLPGAAGLWVGTKCGVALVSGDGRGVTVLNPARDPWPTRGLLEDGEGGLWMVNKEEGLVRYRATARGGASRFAPERFPRAADPTPASLWSLARDRSGQLWLGGSGALFRFDPAAPRPRDGPCCQRYPAEGLVATDRLLQLLFDEHQHLWFRSDEAVGVIDTSQAPPRWAALPLPRAAWLAAAPDGGVLVAAEEGLFRLTRSAGRIRVLSQAGPAEGYPRGAVYSGTALPAPGGSLLFAATDGLYRYDATRATGPRPARVHLRSLRLFDQALPLPTALRPLVLRHDQNFLTVEFDAIAFPAPGMIELRYRLEGLSPSWSPPTRERSASFWRLPPGRYTVVVQARHGGGWDSEARSGPIVIQPALWQTWWFRTLTLALLLSLPLLWVRVLRRQRGHLRLEVAARTAELARHGEHLEERVTERTAELDRAYALLLTQEVERGRAADALAAARREAALGRMAGVVAHQVNTPLAAIKARLSLLREDCGDDDEASASLAVIDRQVDRIARTVRVLLGFVRTREKGNANPRVAAVVQAVAELYSDALRSKGARLDLALPEEQLRIQGPSDDLQEVLLNLVENARAAVEHDGVVRISVARAHEQVRLVVEDDGPGLRGDPEQLFQPFYTTKTTGNGLGLAIARRIAEANGGTLIGEDRGPAARGARFVLTLPLAADTTTSTPELTGSGA